MTNKKMITLAVAAALLSANALADTATSSAENAVLVMFKHGVSKQERETVIQQHGASLRQLDAQGRDMKMRYVADGRIVKVQVPKGVQRDHLIKKLASNPAVEVAEPDYPLHALAVPNDPRFGDLWGLQNTGQSGGTAGADIKAVDAWDISTGSHDIIIGVIDSGMDYTHPDLLDNRWVNPGNLPGSTYGYSTLNAEQDPMDSDSHGTHVAGTIGASGNNGVGITGVNWSVTLLPCQFLGPLGGSTAGAIECINYFTDLKLNHGVDIKATNNSWGGGAFSETLRAAIQSGGDAGILFIAAAGNNGADADSTPMYPAAYDLDVIVSVASTDRNDNLSIFTNGASNYGATSVDLGAPGSAILSTVPGGGYASYSGTSMASPHVAGAAALLWSVNPDITPLEMKAILMDSGDSLPALDGKTVSGKRLNLSSAMVEADPTPSFKLSISPRTQQITAGDAAQYTLDVGNIADWAGEVALSVDVQPALDGVSLSASTAQPGDTVTLDVVTSADTDWGSYQFTVTGVDSATGELVKSVNASLNILPQGLQDYSFSNNTAVPIPDNNAAGIESIISVPQTGVVFGTDVGVNITHTWRGDLIVKLRSPEGTEHMLHNRTGGSADDLIQNWQVDSFNSESMQGDWTLLVSDNAGLDTGTLNSWTLTLTALSDDDTPPGPVAPVADFSFVASGLTVSFTDLSTDADNDISSWSWDFGDGNQADTANPSHTYASSGSYSVSLTTTDSTGLSNTAQKTVTVTDSTIVLSLQRSVRTRTGSTIVDLRWTGASGELDLFRDGQLVETIDNSGSYRDRFNSQAATVTYKICLAGTDACSADLTVNF
ncbi:PKD domain-containing protein [Rheinheimera pacifica]|uniref:PKD domain-containing protein n=1 Tax=Rheinheimera pacifica TaxID=173990 RepID=A0A1H6MHJ5_9GAMM|nr:S8 family serine peptidase [Rheinheimera pacifica]SEH97080.1 PKD domain-containing protein [Rheinheimera pacifica]